MHVVLYWGMFELCRGHIIVWSVLILVIHHMFLIIHINDLPPINLLAFDPKWIFESWCIFYWCVYLVIFWLCLFFRSKTFFSKWWVKIYYFYSFGILLLSHFFSFTCHVLCFLNIFHFISKQLIRRICFVLIQLHLQQSRFQQMSESIITKNILFFLFICLFHVLNRALSHRICILSLSCNLSLYGWWEAWENCIKLLSLCNVVSFFCSSN